MKLVSSQTEEELEKRRLERERLGKRRKIAIAKCEAERALKELTANLLHVIGGEGRGSAIRTQLTDCALAMYAYWELAGEDLGDDDIIAMISVDREHDGRLAEDDPSLDFVMTGGLQVVATRLLGKRNRTGAGDGKQASDGAAAGASNRRRIGRKVALAPHASSQDRQ